jgi:small conductance mechanosensitive channel
MVASFKSISSHRWLAVVCFTLLLLTAPATLSQDAPAESDTTAEAVPGPKSEPSEKDRTRQDLVRLDDLRDSLRQIESQKGIEGEERNLLRLEALKILEEYDGLTAKLAKGLSKIDSATAFTDSIMTVTVSHLEYLGRLYARVIDRAKDRLADMRSERQDLTPAELGDFETNMTVERDVFNRILAWAVALGYTFETLELDASPVWQRLDSELIDRATSLVGLFQVANLERERINSQIDAAHKVGAPEEELADLRIRLQAVEQRISGIVKSLNFTADLMDRRGLDTTEYRQMIIATTGEITEDILDPKVLWGLLKDAWRSMLRWIRDNGPAIAVKLVILLLFVLLFRLLGRIGWWLFLLLRRHKLSLLLRDLVGRLIHPISVLIGLVVGLWFLGVNPTTLLAGVGVASVIVGLALQESLGNLAAGFFILVYRPYDVDDIVRAGGILGKVKEMGLANTTIITFDNRRLFVPNRKILSEVIENRSSEHCRRVQTTVRIAYDQDVDAAIALIRESLDQHELILDKPEPSIFVENLADSWIEIAVWPWTRTETWWDLTIELPKILRLCLQEGGITIPYPRQEVELSSESNSRNPEENEI